MSRSEVREEGRLVTQIGLGYDGIIAVVICCPGGENLDPIDITFSPPNH